ncbi:hypothetical protein DVH26_23445 [Paenibacillus sp. H1-7]|uniref:hypothetical protein n=1 Tax=Paenibacillus sp. H1-7 TaxID=2282849 RepID=UPI001EF7A591|nr:hypothetical protein [Paenibacillus sp. H1-7]ULL17135.1 hypothetical protein DVH26_23445 [Paenibacillus sp. H1-7]
MIRYIIASSDKRKEAVIAADDGEIKLTLHIAGDRTPYFAGDLHSMLSYSAGRPWRFEGTRLEGAHITADHDSVLIKGQLESLSFKLKLAYDENQLLKLYAAWENRTGTQLNDIAVGILFELPRNGEEIITIPHMIYNNNPSSDPSRLVPRLGIGEGKGFVCEEHRLPIPCVNVGWTEEGRGRYFSLYSVPSYVESADGAVQYGSLGAVQEEHRLVMTAMSGVLMFNGTKDTVYVAKSKIQPYNGGYMDFPPGFSLAKEYALDWGALQRPGYGFREVVHKGLDLYAPEGAKPLTTEEMVQLKSHALDDRWRTGKSGAAGYIKFTDSNPFGNVSKHPLHYMYGWTGQCLKLAWCDAKLGFDLGQEERIERCIRAVDFYVKESRTGIPGVRHSSYRLAEEQWDDFSWNGQPVLSSRAYGETAADLADIIQLFAGQSRDIPPAWMDALIETAEFCTSGGLASGIMPAAWLMDGTPADEMITAAGLPCLIALAKASQVAGDNRYLSAAEMMMQRYYEFHAATFERPFARSTLDAKCEDKEAGMYFFMAAYELYAITGQTRYKEWAELSADWLLTYVFLWNPAYDQGSAFRNAGFNAVGWPGVSVQNHHLDVFFPTFEFYRFGQLAGNPVYERLGRMIFGAMGQGICTQPGEWKFTVIGEQAEGFFQTNWNHRGHSNKWNPSWVIALVLQNALRFQDAVTGD